MHGPDPPALADAPPDPDVGTHRWVVRDWSLIARDKLRSEPFAVGGFNWQILVFPRGNNQEYVSVYLDAADAASLPPGWSQHAAFTLSMEVEPRGGEPASATAARGVSKDTQHTFGPNETDWGFAQFVPLADLDDPDRGLLRADDSVVIVASVRVRKDPNDWNYDSRAETGHVGLKNQGATCYMNSLLQTLFHVPYFRKAVYHMPTTESDEASASIPLALQALFYKLQVAPGAASTEDLTRSFGWDAYDSFMQHDVQELNRVLCEKLEEKMKGTSVEGTIAKLFEGHTVNYINCVDVEYKSERKEAYLDLQLDVKGCKDVYASFDKYVEVEKMDGDNKYRAEGHGLQDADKGVLFTAFPPVLQLQLKRFEYDFNRDAMVKINDRYEFPEVLDLDAGDGKYLTPDADRSVRNKYLLHSVLVHSGGVNGGHYYAFIRPTLRGDAWFKFDDERVTKEREKRALDDNFGEDPDFLGKGVRVPKFANAYMLVYVRESDMAQIVCDANEDDIAEHVLARLRKEREEKERRKKEEAEAHLIVQTRLATAETMKAHVGSEIFFDMCEHESLPARRVRKETPFLEWKKSVAEETGVPPNRQRYWAFVKRQNATVRPQSPIDPAAELGAMCALRDKLNPLLPNKYVDPEDPRDLRLFLEVVSEEEARSAPRERDAADAEFPAGVAPRVPADHELLFFKFYDPNTETLEFLGHALCHKESSVRLEEAKIRALCGARLAAGAPFDVFEEIKSEPSLMVEKAGWDVPFHHNSMSLGSGDILVVQPRIIADEGAANAANRASGAMSGANSQIRFPEVDQFFAHVRDARRVSFREVSSPRDEKLSLDLSKSMSYDDVCAALADALGVADATTLRLTQHNAYTNAPKTPLAFRGIDALADALPPRSGLEPGRAGAGRRAKHDILYYEVLDMPLPALERLKSLRVHFHGKDTRLLDVVNVRVPKESNVADAMAELRRALGEKKVSPSRALRFMETYQSKIFKVFAPDDTIDNINDNYWVLRAEEVPEDEALFGDSESVAPRGANSADDPNDPNSNESGDALVCVYHFYRERAAVISATATAGEQTNNKESVHLFGDPFFMRVSRDETLGSVKARARVKLGVAEKTFAEWRWAFHSLGATSEPLADSERVAALFSNTRKDAYGAYESYLGAEHADPSPRKTAAAKRQANAGGFDQRAVKIYG